MILKSGAKTNPSPVDVRETRPQHSRLDLVQPRVLPAGTIDRIPAAPAVLPKTANGRSKLVIRPDSIQWDHLLNTRPGRWRYDGLFKVPGHPTTINGTPWLPRWPDNDEESPGVSDPLDAMVRFDTKAVTLASVDGRPAVRILP